MATERSRKGRTRLRRPAGWLSAALLTLAVTQAATPTGLRSILEKAESSLEQAEKAVRSGKDPGKVSVQLVRLDELLASFQEASGLEGLAKAFEDGRAAAHGSDMQAAAEAVRKASNLMSALTDYVVLRQAAETSRMALRAADSRDGAAYLEALDRFDASILAPVLLARVREARAAIVRARHAMVHNNIPDGRERIAEVRRAMSGLIYAGALSRAAYSLAIGSELLEEQSPITARDQLSRALRELKLAAEVGPGDQGQALLEMRDQTAEIWKRSSRVVDGDPEHLAELARKVDALRLQQPR